MSDGESGFPGPRGKSASSAAASGAGGLESSSVAERIRSTPDDWDQRNHNLKSANWGQLPQALRMRLVKFAGRACLFLFAVSHLWAGAYQINTDGICYLDIGDAFFTGNWAAALNPYWSPAYALVLGAIRHIFPVPMRWEFPQLHVINLLIFLLDILCFEIFWSVVFLGDHNSKEEHGSTEIAWWITGYAMFALTAAVQRAIELPTPDLMVTGFVLLAAGLVVRARATLRITHFLALGAVLGFGYIAKAPLYPMAPFFIAAAAIRPTVDRRLLARVGVAFLAFAVISTPLVFLLSKRAGRFTFGESARINMAWKINGVGWGGGAGFGTPIHPPRHIWTLPDIYEFASIPGTYPLSDDPFYWQEGVWAHPELHKMLRTATENLKSYVRFLFVDFYTVPLAIFLMLAVLQHNWRAMLLQLLKRWPLLLVGISGLCLYAPLYVEPRFVGAYFLLLWSGLFLATGAYAVDNARLARAAAISLAIMLVPILAEGVRAERKLTVLQNNVLTAIAAKQAGIRPGDKIASVGDAHILSRWAKLDRISIVAEVGNYSSTFGEVNVAGWQSSEVPKKGPVYDAMRGEVGSYRSMVQDSATFFQLTDAQRAAAYEALRRIDVRVLVAVTPSTGVPEGWHQIADTPFSLKFLR